MNLKRANTKQSQNFYQSSEKLNNFNIKYNNTNVISGKKLYFNEENIINNDQENEKAKKEIRKITAESSLNSLFNRSISIFKKNRYKRNATINLDKKTVKNKSQASNSSLLFNTNEMNNINKNNKKAPLSNIIDYFQGNIIDSIRHHEQTKNKDDFHFSSRNFKFYNFLIENEKKRHTFHSEVNTKKLISNKRKSTSFIPLLNLNKIKYDNNFIFPSKHITNKKLFEEENSFKTNPKEDHIYTKNNEKQMKSAGNIKAIQRRKSSSAKIILEENSANFSNQNNQKSFNITNQGLIRGSSNKEFKNASELSEKNKNNEENTQPFNNINKLSFNKSEFVKSHSNTLFSNHQKSKLSFYKNSNNINFFNKTFHGNWSNNTITMNIDKNNNKNFNNLLDHLQFKTLNKAENNQESEIIRSKKLFINISFQHMKINY